MAKTRVNRIWSGRRRWNEDVARAVLDALKDSGLSPVAFAEREGLDVERLYRWRRVLERGSEPAFVELNVAEHGAGQLAGFEVVLRSNRVVRVPARFDESALRRLIATLEQEAKGC